MIQVLQFAGCSHMISIMQLDFLSLLSSIRHRELSFASQEMVFDMDAEVSSLFVVKSGLVHLVRFQEDGGMVVLQRAQSRSVLAEASVLSDSYHCAAMAMQPSVLKAYPRKSVQKLLESNPKAALAYARFLAAEMRTARKRAEILALKTVAERLTAWLTWNHGGLPARGTWHHVADEIGISKEALYRELAKRR